MHRSLYPLLALVAIALLSVTGSHALGPGELFVDADDALCTDVPGEGAGASATPFCSIQVAIDFLEAQIDRGGKLTLRAAEYDEGTITTNHADLVIRGDPAVLRSSIVIKPSGADDIGVHITDPLAVCGNITIEHLTIDGGGHHANRQGILVDDTCEPITINDVEISDWTREGILFADSSGDEGTTASNGAAISDSRIANNGGVGVELNDGTGNRMADIEVSGNDDGGIATNRQAGFRLSSGLITDNGFHGMADFEGTNTIVEDSEISGNLGHGLVATGPHSGLRLFDSTILMNSGAGLHLDVGLFGAGGTDTIIARNEIRGNGGHGARAHRQDRLKMTNNDIIENLGSGVLLEEGTDATVEESWIAGNADTGITALDQADLEIRANEINQNGGYGVRVARGDDNLLDNNSATENGAAGVRADDMVGLTIQSSEILANAAAGIELFDGTDTSIDLNDIGENGGSGVTSMRELGLAIHYNDIHENHGHGVLLTNGTNGSVKGNSAIADNGSEGLPLGYGISINGETNLALDKNVLSRNLNGQILINSSDDVSVKRNDFVTAVDGIVLIDDLAHPFLGLVIGGSTGDRNRFRGLDPATNECDTPADRCYLEVQEVIIGAGTIDARHNDWGTTDPSQIEALICHNGEPPCGSNRVDYSGPQPPGDSPADKEVPTPTPAGTVGDANCDGTVNSIDAALILQNSAGLVSAVPCPAGADANGNGVVNSLDAALVLQFVAGLLFSL